MANRKGTADPACRPMEDPTLDSALEDYLKYSRLIRSHGQRLSNRLSPEDQEALRQLALRDPAEMEPISEAYSQARLHLCARRGSMTPVEIAEEWSRMVLEWRLENVARYRKGLEALSEAGRNTVEEYIATEIVPRLDLPSPSDAINDATEDPEGFMEAVELECYFVEKGEYPPDVQQKLEEFEKKMEEEDWQPPD